MIRIVLTGSECTGKTTLAEALALHYRTGLVPEFVRGYAEQRGGIIELSDHAPIARGQIALEDSYIARGGRLLIQDTDLLSTVVYCRHYFGMCEAWIEEAWIAVAGASLEAAWIAAAYAAQAAAAQIAAEPAAANAAAGAALQPTVKRLQLSAWALLDRLCAPGEQLAPPVKSLEEDAGEA